jgi:hypothetical protein
MQSRDTVRWAVIALAGGLAACGSLAKEPDAAPDVAFARDGGVDVDATAAGPVDAALEVIPPRPPSWLPRSNPGARTARGAA